MRCHRPLPDDVALKALTIRKEDGKWFASFSFAIDREIEFKDALPSLAIDVGLHEYVVASNGYRCQYPKALRRSLQRLKRLQRRFVKSVKQTQRWKTLLRAIQKTHFRVKCQRRVFLHKTANALLAQTDCLIHEDLQIANMLRRPKPKQDEQGTFLPNGASRLAGLHLSIGDAAWGEFFHIIDYKVKE